MVDVVSFLAEVFVLFVVVWFAIFGTTAALLSRARGGDPSTGFVWGVALGPIGWAAIWWRTRGAQPIDVDEWINRPAFTAPAETAIDERRPGGLRF